MTELRQLLPIFEEVEWSARSELRVWLLEEAQAAYSTADDMMDVAADSEEFGRACTARDDAERAISASFGSLTQTSTAVVGIIDAWRGLRLHDDPISEMKSRLLGFLSAVDALAFLVRPEIT